MPDKVFLETYPLYRKFAVGDLPTTLNVLPKPSINMPCSECKSSQTFRMTNDYYENAGRTNYPSAGVTVRLLYVCAHCSKARRFFFVRIGDEVESLTKVGQYPPWDIACDRELEALLGSHSVYYKRGLVCESQSYGIGAYGYYRRIVEEVIDDLLDEIAQLLTGPELEAYRATLDKTKDARVAQDKIDVVKDLLPPILRPEGMNPLSALYSALSEGLHAKSDEDCLAYAAACREVLVFLVNQVAASRASSRKFTESMRKLLDKKAGSAD